MAKHCDVTGEPTATCECGACLDQDDRDPFAVEFNAPPWPEDAA